MSNSFFIFDSGLSVTYCHNRARTAKDFFTIRNHDIDTTIWKIPISKKFARERFLNIIKYVLFDSEYVGNYLQDRGERRIPT